MLKVLFGFKCPGVLYSYSWWITFMILLLCFWILIHGHNHTLHCKKFDRKFNQFQYFTEIFGTQYFHSKLLLFLQ